jgi:outer membrane protein insertion porin family
MNLFKPALFPSGSSTMPLTIAARQEVFLSLVKLVATVCLFLFASQALAAQRPRENAQTNYVVERVEVDGSRRIESGTLRARISSRPGDPYSVEAVRRDVQALRNTQFFDDVRVEVEDSPYRPNGKIVIFLLVEKPIVGRIEYKGIKSITESDILDAFKHERVGVSVGSYFDRTKLAHAAVVISELLAAHGRQFATVKPTYERNPSANTVTLLFSVDEGPKAQRPRNRS